MQTKRKEVGGADEAIAELEIIQFLKTPERFARLGGKIVVDTISTGASDDIQRATEPARRMVTEFGMSEKLGSVRDAGPQLQYLSGALSDMSQLSPHTRDTIDSEIQRIVDAQFERAQHLLAQHRTALDTLTTDLLEAETVDGSVVRLALERSPAAA